MRTRITAVLELALVLPAALFMAALILRNVGSLPYESAHIAQQMVMWYAQRMWTLWVLLLGLPFIVFVSGCAELLRNWNCKIVPQLTSRKPLAIVRENSASFVIAMTTLIAGILLAIAVLHVLAN
jgi:hypothetical protein